MIFDRLVLEALEKYITHPIQRRYSFTNITLARWLTTGLLVMFLLVFFGVIKINLVVYNDIANPNGFNKFVITVVCGTAIYMIVRGFAKDEAKLLNNATKGLMNQRKITFIWQLIRFNMLMHFFAFSFLLLLLILAPAVRDIGSGVGLAIFFNIYSIIFYLVCLDPIPRSKEDVKIPSRVQLDKI